MSGPEHSLGAGPSCAYPPALATDAEIAPQPPSFIAGSASVGRYLLLGTVERRVLDLLDGRRPLDQICQALPGVGVVELSRFLAKLDEVGLLAGERSQQGAAVLGGPYYRRWKLFNPDPLFSRMLPWFHWIWTPQFFVCSVAITVFAFYLILLDWPSFRHHAAITIHTGYLGIFLAAWFVTAVHEFAHGMTAKAFGGRSTEVGFLLVYYVLPGCYCNVSGIHMIPSRGRRLWVIAAGIYSQLLLGSGALLVWLAFSPETWIGQSAMVLALAALLDLFMNGNPLIKLDGYYFLSQWWRMPNLMDRSRACWRDVGRELFLGVPPREAVRFKGRERHILLVFGCLSFSYNIALPLTIVWYGARFLMDWLALPGLVGGGVLAAAFALPPVKKSAQFWFGKENRMAAKEGVRSWRRFVPAGTVVLILAGLLMPWMASVGSYGALVAIPDRESVIRAPENASLMVLSIQPGQQVAAGASIAQMSNLDMDERIAAVRTELARVDADAEKVTGERRVQQEAALTARWQLEQRRRELDDINDEERQIRRRFPDSAHPLASLRTTRVQFVAPAMAQLPPALAALEAETERLHAEWAAADDHRQRTHALAAQGILARSELDSTQWRAASLSAQLVAARDRLKAALIEHERRRAKAQSEANIAGTSVSAAEVQSAGLRMQIEAARKLRESLLETISVLERKRSQFAIPAPRAGTLFGDDLPAMLGKYFQKGTEICRVADIREVLVRVHVGEEALSDIRLGQNVRVKARSFPDRVFQGAVSKIGGEGEIGENGQRTYRLEFTIQNEGGLLKPGMTVFARADFGRRPVIWLLAHKLKQALRPEMWML